MHARHHAWCVCRPQHGKKKKKWPPLLTLLSCGPNVLASSFAHEQLQEAHIVQSWQQCTHDTAPETQTKTSQTITKRGPNGRQTMTE